MARPGPGEATKAGRDEARGHAEGDARGNGFASIIVFADGIERRSAEAHPPVSEAIVAGARILLDSPERLAALDGGVGAGASA